MLLVTMENKRKHKKQDAISWIGTEYLKEIHLEDDFENEIIDRIFGYTLSIWQRNLK